MFLKELSVEQRRMFMALAKRMVLADWKLEPHEQAAIDRVEAELGQSLSVEAKDLLSNDNLGVLTSRKARRIVMYELLVLAQADLTIDSTERYVFDDLAKELKIEPQTMSKLEELSVTGHALLAAGNNDDLHREQVKAVVES
ncbi:MAG TPA: hypothetical protein DCL95_16030 [Rhodospirillaceae bacterium]|nr:hypothetical protein [Rhodospirillaceae bacterium]MAX60998.1 hypothetical protein [Rhodospirillaceae bacterium]MBB55736.1 hypothetical protein [Rhodospirillaceae bacterium]HAE02846.1 hypothetical protein [Rhodospirillaceae bacterium]HAJ21542.1 hypothetical protein [Rhodospirillaceae bacterium]|tara:strand:+ start:208855 stop:209280 length:426 start_codon:yes stop_codon:yes gene_type:complete